jgi:HPt (histidine-containing phosphotransfer) domain-containing protein
MASIDAGTVQQMFGDDLSLFKSLLARMLVEFADFALPIAVSPSDQTNLSRIQGRAHKLKGSAGMIGATRVMRLAGAVEAALQDGRTMDVVERILRQLAAALTILREETELSSEKKLDRDADAVALVANCPKIGNPDVKALCVLLECQNLAAMDKFALLSPALSELVGAVRFERLREAIDNLDFQLGAELLRQTLVA